jgi:Tfp pilus assembly protein FimT
MRDRSSRHGVAGFSLVEMILVVAIIMVLTAVALPNIMGYLKNYKVNAAAQQIATQLTQARGKAIMKNVNLGVLWYVNACTFSSCQTGTIVEDDLQPQVGAPWYAIPGENWATLTTGATGAVQSVSAYIPATIQFADPVARCPTSGAAAAAGDWGLRFTRLGSACQMAAGTPCQGPPPGAPGLAPYITFDVNGNAILCVWDSGSALSRWITVSPAGRITVQPT